MLLEGKCAPKDPCVWETAASLDMASCIPEGAGGIAIGIYQFLAGLIEFGLERILHRAIGRFNGQEPQPTGSPASGTLSRSFAARALGGAAKRRDWRSGAVGAVLRRVETLVTAERGVR